MTAVLFTITLASADDDQLKKLKFEMGGVWSTIAVWPQAVLSDCVQEGPYLIIQHLPDNRVLLSRCEKSIWRPITPEAVRFVDSDELERILSEVVKIFAEAKELDRSRSEHPRTMLEISIRKPSGNRNFSKVLDNLGQVTALSGLINESLQPE
jgi:hypothetical protein